jgi:choline monooxygenase
VAVSVAGYPLIVVRGEDGVCALSTMSAAIAPDRWPTTAKENVRGALVCRYHGWRYALDGRLANARDFGPAEGFDPRDYALYPVRCESWRGFVFVNMDRDAPPLSRAQPPCSTNACATWPLETYPLHAPLDARNRCNWKTYVENYLEGYHVPNVHPALERRDRRGAVQGRNPGARDVLFGAAARRLAVSGVWGWLWPCLGINVYTNGVMMERMWPIDHATRGSTISISSRRICRNPRSRVRWRFGSDHRRRHGDHRGRAAQSRCRHLRKGRLSPKHETGIAWFQSEIQRAVGD